MSRTHAVVVALLLAACVDGGPLTVDDDDDVVAPPTGVGDQRSELWVRDEVASPGSVTFNELHYHPVDPDLEWIELHNPMVLPMDVSGWRLEGAVGFVFPEGTVLPPGSWTVVAALPERLAELGVVALGPYAGRLPDDGARIELRNATDRRIDSVGYGDDDPWPVAPDGAGPTLAKRDADAASDRAEHWTASVEVGGTPGRANGLDPDAPATVLDLLELAGEVWRYDLSGAPDAGWADPDFDDSAWPSGPSIFYAGAPQVGVAATIRVTADNYFGLYAGDAAGTELRLLGAELDDSWTTVETFEVDLGPADHLFLAAWELPGVLGGPQMVIAEVALPDAVVGTAVDTFDWVLGPPGAAPPERSSPPPPVDAIEQVVQDADLDAAWAAPAAEAGPGSSPWGGAVGGFFSAGRYLWGDTFDAASVTNAEDTYALFRSVAPLGGGGGETELPTIPTTALFRTSFALNAAPAAATLTLDCLLDDGAVVYLNGVEAARYNVPEGPVGPDTLADVSLDGPDRVSLDLATTSLARGNNVLVVELHQAAIDDDDLTFGCGLRARIGPGDSGAAPAVLLHEVAPAGAAPFWVELQAQASVDLDGLALASTSGESTPLTGSLDAGDLRVIEPTFAVSAGDVLSLRAADGAVVDAVRLSRGLRGRSEGAWRSPVEATPGAANAFAFTTDVVLHELHYHAPPVSREGEPVTARGEEWIELHNRGPDPVDLSGWQIVDAVAFEFPDDTVLGAGGYLVVARDAEAVRAAHPGVDVLGDFDGRLDNRTDRVVLRDAAGNPADVVRYYDGGRWPEAADGGGATLELRDPWADNAAGEAWAASDEAGRTTWASYSYRGPAGSSAVGPDGRWHELVLGLLDSGEVLIDDVSVIEDPDGARVERVRDGGFDAGDAWRLLGTHGTSEVVDDPDEPGNRVLRLVATGPTGHMHNHAETTLLASITAGEYEIAFKARWVSGSNQLHSRLYFHRLARTTLLPQPDRAGTPGAPNSVGVVDLGPTFEGLRHEPAVPPPNTPVSVSVAATDPDGVAAMTLWSSVDGAPFSPQPMSETAGRWTATLDGRPAGSIVAVYVEAEDGGGNASTHPAAGPDSRALIAFDDGLAATNGLHNLRIVMTEPDAAFFHRDTNLMSNARVGATVVYDESEVFYDVGVRAKGSQRGRPRVPRLGFGVKFPPDRLFRGSRRSVLIDRSEGVGYGQREVLLNLAMTAAGSVSGEYNDVVHVIAPRPEHTGGAELQLDRFSDLVLGSQFTDGADGTRFEYELVYYPTTTDDGTPEGLKLPQPDQVVGTDITWFGDDPEPYRWIFLIKNNERQDDYSRVVDLGRTFWLDDPAFRAQAADVIDVDQWLRAFAFSTLSGATDQYGGAGSRHNAQVYVRPSDQRVLFFPHDLDFFGSARMPVVNNNDLRRLLVDPANRRAYYGHLQDILDRSYSPAYLQPWCDRLGELLPAQPFASHCAFIGERAQWVASDAPESIAAVFPPRDFAITTEGGADFTVAGADVTLEGEAGVEVRSIRVGAVEASVAWVDAATWRITVPLEPGPNELALDALDLRGRIVGSDSVVVTSGR